jgi:hypothetical protein
MGRRDEPGGSVKAAVTALRTVTLGLLAAETRGMPAYRPNMTGEQLVRDMLADPAVGRNSIKRERAMGYMDGVMDASAGVRWCPAGTNTPHELNYVVAEETQTLSPARLKGGAAALMLEALGRHYPCAAAGAKP